VAVHDANAGSLDAERAIAATLGVAERAGADLRFGERVVAWRPTPGGGFEVETAEGSVVGADRLVITVGPWTGGLVADLRLPLAVERQPVLWLEPANGGGADRLALDSLPIWLWSTDRGTYYGFPWDDELGLKVAHHHGGAIVEPEAVDRTVRPADEADIRTFVRDRMPAMDGRVRSSTVCLYTNTPEFVVDRHPAADGVAFASACSGHGFKFAPIVAELLADLVTGAEPGWPMEAFRADRFGAT
jgi:sarcosine oxidase